MEIIWGNVWFGISLLYTLYNKADFLRRWGGRGIYLK